MMKIKLAITLFALINTINSAPALRGLQEAVATEPISILAPVELATPVESPVVSTTPPSFNNLRLKGLGKLVQDLVLASNSSESTFDILELNVLDESGTDAGMAYQGEIILTNTKNVSVTGLFSGLYDPVDNKIALYASEIEVADDHNDTDINNDRDDGYTELPPTATNDNGVIQDALAYGIKAVVETGLSQKKIPTASPDYILTSLNSVGYKANGEKGIWIRFIITLENSLTYKVDSNITIYYKNSDSSYKLSYYKYKSYNWPDSAFPTVDNTKHNSTAPANTTVPANATVPRADGFADLPLTAVNDNGVFHDALAFGIKAVVETGISQKKIPAASPDYTLASLSSVGYKTNGNVGIWVRFIISVQNSLNYKVDSNITIFYRNSNSSYKLSYYNYKSSGFPDSALSTGNTNTTAPATNQPQPSLPVYYPLSWDEVAQNQQIHGALDFGIYTAIQKGITNSKIPAASPDYTLTQNSTAMYYASAKGVIYMFTVSLKNALNYKVDLSVTVFFNNSDVTYSLNAYSLASSGYPSSALTTSSSSTSAPVASTVSSSANGGKN